MIKNNNQAQVAGLILTFNDDKIVLKCIESVMLSDYNNLKIYLVDNGSDYDLTEILKNKYPLMNYIRINENMGYAGGFNYAMKYILNRGEKIDFFWLINNDVSVEKDALSKLISVMIKSPDIGFIGPETFKRDCSGKHDQWITKRNTKENPAGIVLDDEIDAKGREIIDVEFVVGHCILIRFEVIKSVGMMRPGFDDLSGGYLENVNPKIEFWKQNLVDSDLNKCFEEHKFDYVFHFARAITHKLFFPK